MRFPYSLLCQCEYKLKLFKMDFMITLFWSSFCKCWWCNIDFVKMTSVEDYDTPLGHEQHLREHEPLVFWILLKVMDQTWKLSWAGIESDGNVESNISQPWLLIGIKRPFLTDWQTTCFYLCWGAFKVREKLELNDVPVNERHIDKPQSAELFGPVICGSYPFTHCRGTTVFLCTCNIEKKWSIDK